MRKPVAGIGIALLVWTTSTGAFGQCNFFKPAEPERPHQTPIVPDYSSPTMTLQTIARGIADKNATNGQAVYVGALADSLPTGTDGRAYHAFFDSTDLARHQSWDPNRDYNRTLEGTFYGDFVQLRTTPYEMTWEVFEPHGNDTGSASDSLLHRQYKVYQVISGSRRLIAIGVADLYFVKSPAAVNRWVITRWQDFRSPDARPDISQDEATLGSRRLDKQ